MPQRTAPLVNFAGGLLTKKLLGRVDLASYAMGSLICRNFLTEVQGPRSYRFGSRYVIHTRLNGVTNLIPFNFNDEESYALAFSGGKFRVFSDGGVILETALAIEDISQADPGVIEITGHDFDSGDEVFIDGVEGMTELNGKFFIVAAIDVDTFSLKDIDGNDIDTSGYGAYVSDGTVARVYEEDSPYAAADLFGLKYAQKADLMYIVHPDYEIRKLRRFGETDWRLETFTRTSDPFTSAITNATQADPCVITSVGHGLITGDIIEIYGVEGMVELNGNTYAVVRLDDDTFSLKDLNGVDIDSTGYTVYTGEGYFFGQGDMPIAVGFYGGRVLYGGVSSDPDTFYGSRAPDDDGAYRFDDFTTGSNDDDAIVFPIASQNNTADRIQWFAGTTSFLAIGTFGAMYKAYGATTGAPISGTAVTVQPIDFYGVKSILPVRVGTAIYYVQRGGLVLNRFAYSIFEDGYSSEDLNILSDEITKTGIAQLAVQQGRLNVVWAVRNDGVLLGMSTKEQEKIAAWHEHYLGGIDAEVLSICGEPQPDNDDNLWLVVERTIDGVTRRYMEYFTPDPVLPEREEFYTGDKVVDDDAYVRRQLEVAKQYVRLDSALVLDTTQAVTITPDAETGEDITFTAGSAVFVATDVGRRIVRKSVTGYETGVAEITAYVSATEVTCDILDDFDSDDLIPANEWYLTVTAVSGLDHLEGETVKILTDGAVHPAQVVVDGAIDLDYPATVVHVGLGYQGWIKSMPLHPSTLVGTSISRTMTLDKVGVLFRHTLGTRFGASEYKLEQLLFRTTNDRTGNPPPLFSGIKEIFVKDGYDDEKYVHVIQDEPLPCTIQAIIPYVNVTEE